MAELFIVQMTKTGLGIFKAIKPEVWDIWKFFP